MSAAVHANNLRKKLGIEFPPFSPQKAFEKLGVVYKEQPLDGCLGMTIRIPGSDLAGVIVSSEIAEQGRINFTAAHELGHLTIPSHATDTFKCTESSLDLFNTRANNKEVEANQFAAEWLLPRAVFREKSKSNEPGFDLIHSLSATFNTSITATALRLVDLSDHRLMLVVSNNGQIKYFKKSEDFPYFLSMGTTPKSYVREVANGKLEQEDYLSTDSDLWFNGRQPESQEVYEWSLKLGDYPTVLTLLWVDD